MPKGKNHYMHAGLYVVSYINYIIMMTIKYIAYVLIGHHLITFKRCIIIGHY